MRSLITLSLFTVLASCATSSGRTNASQPADGRALLAQMHDRYAGRWFQTLTFVQRTTQRRQDGTTQVSTWYEALRGTRLRIDVGDPSAGNGALYTPDSLYVVRAGKVVKTMGEGNPFLPLIMGVYIQPLDLTVAQIAPLKVDLSRIRVQDVRLENNVAVGNGWLATKVRMLDQGNAIQTEEYSDWKVNVPLPETFFQVEHWSDAPHWAKKQ